MDWSQLEQDLRRIGGVGRTEAGGITRLLFSPAYQQAARLLLEELTALGLEAWQDRVGNVHGLLPCRRAGAPTLYVGSHLDTVTEGGLYDGALGVLAGVACVRALLAEGRQLPFHLHLLATNGEEGNDLGGTFGSRCMMGLVDTAQPGYLNIAARFGVTEEDIRSARLDTANALGYLELHIEQGKTLDETGEDVGAVTGIVGLRRLAATVTGEANHAGTTLMPFRRDALVGAARLVLLVDELARSFDGQLVATVGKCQVFPNSAPVIPGRTELVVEYRSLSAGLMDRFERQLRQRAGEIPQVVVDFAPIVEKAPVACDEGFLQCIAASCRERGLAWRRMPSGATHDGNAFAQRMPIGMIFVPSRDGISHNKDEYTDWNHICRGAEVLYDTILSLGERFETKE